MATAQASSSRTWYMREGGLSGGPQAGAPRGAADLDPRQHESSADGGSKVSPTRHREVSGPVTGDERPSMSTNRLERATPLQRGKPYPTTPTGTNRASPTGVGLTASRPGARARSPGGPAARRLGGPRRW